MENKGKRNRMRFFASCLAVVMCLSMVDTSLFFPVSAEGETTPVEQTPEIAQTDPAVEGQPEETAPEEGTEPGTEMSEPDVPAVEQPVKSEEPVNDGAVQPEEEVQEPEESEAENPDIISVQTLEAKATAGEIRADDVITVFDVKDTEGNQLPGSGITDFRLGWVRNAGLPDELELSGNHYMLKGVKVDGKECLYITKYNNDYYYSYDGESGIKVNTNQRFVIEYWQYHNVTFSGENIDKLDVSVEKQELKYGDDTSLSLKSFVSSPEKVLDGNVYKVYVGKQLRWEKHRGKDTENRIEYLISDVLVNGTADSEFAKEGEAVEEVIRDTEIVVNGAENSSPRVDFASGNISAKDPEDLVFPNATHEIQFTITTQSALGKTSLVLDGELNEIAVPSNRESAKETVIPNSPYVITVDKTSGQYEYKFTVTRSDGNPIREDLEFVSEDKTSWWSSDVNIRNKAEEVIVAKLTGHNVSVISPPDNRYNVNLLTPSITIFMKAQTGYFLNDLPSNVPADGPLGSLRGNLSVDEYSISNYPNDSIKEKAMRMGFTHYAVLTRDRGILTSFTVNVTASPIAAEYRISDETKQKTDYREKASYMLPSYNSGSSVFHGWKLNGNDQRLYQPGETFELTDRTWNLGTLENPDNPDSTRIFNFEPVTGNEYYSYTIEHYLQNNDGSYPTDPSETAKGVSLQTSGSYVVGIPRVYSDHTFDSTVEGTKQGIDFSDSTDSRVIKLYYRKNFQYANVQIATHIDGKLADKNKKFTYTVKAEKEDASNRIDPLKDDVFKSEGWKRDPDGNYYVKSFEHGAEEVYDLGNVPVTNCKYTVSLNGENAFYETTKHTVENGTATTPVSGASHTFAGSAMTPNAIHEVHFTHTASDVVPTGNIFEDKGFDLMLATTAVLGLLCAVYAVFRRRMQIR